MNTVVNEFDKDTVKQSMLDGLAVAVVSQVSLAVERGITRIKRNALVNDLIQMLFTNVLSASSTAIGESLIIDTLCCRIAITIHGFNHTTILISGNDELSPPIEIITKSTGFTVNGNNFEMQSLIVMVTSLLLKNSPDSSDQVVEVITQS